MAKSTSAASGNDAVWFCFVVAFPAPTAYLVVGFAHASTADTGLVCAPHLQINGPNKTMDRNGANIHKSLSFFLKFCPFYANFIHKILYFLRNFNQKFEMETKKMSFL